MKNKFIEPVLEASLLIGLLTFFITFVIYFWRQSSGLNIIDIIMLPLIPALFLFVLPVIINRITIKKFYNKTDFDDISIKSKYKIVLSICLTTLFIFSFLDIFFFMFDNSFPKDYSASFVKLIIQNMGTTEEVIEAKNIAELPYSYQNIILNFTCSLIGNLISLKFIKLNKIKV